jgi:hypothetical protein
MGEVDTLIWPNALQRTPRRSLGLFDNVWPVPRPAGAESLSLGRWTKNMNIKLLSASSCAAILGAVIGYGISSSSMPDNLVQSDSSIYIADFRTVDAEDGSPINTRMSPGEIMIAQRNSGEEPRSLSCGFCMHSEVDNGHWRIIWKDVPSGRRMIELSAEGYEATVLPPEMIHEVREGANITVGGILGPDTVKMKKTTQAPPSNR